LHRNDAAAKARSRLTLSPGPARFLLSDDGDLDFIVKNHRDFRQEAAMLSRRFLLSNAGRADFRPALSFLGRGG